MDPYGSTSVAVLPASPAWHPLLIIRRPLATDCIHPSSAGISTRKIDSQGEKSEDLIVSSPRASLSIVPHSGHSASSRPPSHRHGYITNAVLIVRLNRHGHGFRCIKAPFRMPPYQLLASSSTASVGAYKLLTFTYLQFSPHGSDGAVLISCQFP
jgi:hypothetical protein